MGVWDGDISVALGLAIGVGDDNEVGVLDGSNCVALGGMVGDKNKVDVLDGGTGVALGIGLLCNARLGITTGKAVG